MENKSSPNILKIVAPLYSVREVRKLIREGADELFCGVIDSKEKIFFADSYNTRDMREANLESFDELTQAADIAHSLNKKIAITINEHYNQTKFDNALRHAQRAAQSGVDAFIIADIGFLLKLREEGFFGKKVHISSMAGVFNSKAAAFYQSLGVSRWIAPQDISLTELRELSLPGMEREVFILNHKCPNINAFCRFVHGVYSVSRIQPRLRGKGTLTKKQFLVSEILYAIPEGLKRNIMKNTFACCLEYQCSCSGLEDCGKGAVATPRRITDIDSYLLKCGACCLPQFLQMGISYLKIVGRGNTTRHKCKDVRFLRELIQLVGSTKDEDDFERRAKALRVKFYRRERCGEPFCFYIK